MDLFDLSSALFGRKGMDSDSVEYEETTRTYVGTATSDSADGSVYVELSEDVTMPDEYEGEHGMGVEMPTVPGVSEGDEVLVTVFGSGAMKSPVVTGNAGEGDRQNAAIAAAHAIANAAQAVAEAVNQHFWHDTNGAHVTEATQEEWEQSHSGPNSLWNSLGMLFRDGLNNLLALVGGSNPGVAIYDGLGNAAENVVATFDGDGIGLVGGAFRLTSERVTEEYGDENNPTTMTEIRSTINTEASNDSYATRCFLRSGLTEGDAAGGGVWELVSETDINPEFPTDTKNASVEVGSDPWGSSVRLVADSQELHLHKHPIDGKDYFDLHSEVFMITDYHNGVCVWSTAPGTVLWSSGGWHMAANHTANLAYNVSTCPTGIVLHFQPYTSSTTQNYNHIYYFVPKEHVASYNGTGVVVQLGNPNFSNMASKYLYISNDHITGHANNTATGTNSGISYNNAAWVMTQVIAV